MAWGSGEALYAVGLPSVTSADSPGLFKYPDGLAANFSTQRAQQK
jgi:hypothetical protein